MSPPMRTAALGLVASIEGLAALETRYTFGDGDDHTN